MVTFTSPLVPLKSSCPAAFTAFIIVLNALLSMLPLESSTKATLKSWSWLAATLATSLRANGVSSSTLIDNVPSALSPSLSVT